MRYKEEIVEEVRAGNDIVDIISGYVKLKRQGNSYFGLCPFHSEKSPSFSVSQDKQMYYCFGCGAGGNVYTFLMQYENLTFQEAVKMLAERAGIALPEGEVTQEERRAQDRKTILLAIQKEAAKYYYAVLHSKEGAPGMSYLKKRGMDEETILQFGLGFATQNSRSLYRYLLKSFEEPILLDSGLFTFQERYGVQDKFWNRVMFPIMDVNRRVIGFGGRVMGDGKPKYLNSPETEIFEKSRNLYGLHIARKSRSAYLMLCEGYMDVISMHQAGFNNAVASLGTSLTSGHCSLLKRYTGKVLLLYDSDDAGIRAALRAIPMLRDTGIQSKVVSLKPYKDPDEFLKTEGKESFEKRLDEAEDGFLFEIRMLERDFEINEPAGRTEFQHAICRHLLILEDEIARDNYLRTLSGRYFFNVETMRQTVNKLSLEMAGKKTVKMPRQTAKNKLEAGTLKTQKVLITWMVNQPELIPVVLKYLRAEDFDDAVASAMVKMLGAQFEEGGIRPAEIINQFEDGEKQSQAASYFHSALELESGEDRTRALKDMICQIWNDSLEREIKQSTGITQLQDLVARRKALDDFKFNGMLQLPFAWKEE